VDQESSCSERLLGIGHVCRLHYIRAHQLLERLDLYRGQPKVLYALWAEEGLSHTELAARIHVSAPTVTKMVQRLVKAGMLVRREDPEDQRVSRIYLTEAGRAIRSEVERTWAQLDAESLSGFSVEERTQFVAYLMRVEQNLIRATSGAAPSDEANIVNDHESEENVECN
jgi:MarR family transcriptional regulator, organic hydroperoxide resistance regulator